MTLDHERLLDNIRRKLQNWYFEQPITSQNSSNQTQQLVYHATKSLHELARHAKPENPKELPKAYLDVMELTWRLAEAVYLCLHTTESMDKNNLHTGSSAESQGMGAGYHISNLDKFIGIAEDISNFMEGLKSSDFAPCQHTGTEMADHAKCQQCKKKTEANKLKERLVTEVIFTMNVGHVHDTVIRLVELQPLRNGAEAVNIISSDASSVTIAKNNSKIKVTFDAA